MGFDGMNHAVAIAVGLALVLLFVNWMDRR